MSDEAVPPPRREFSEGSKFILSFIQALLKTGYYTPGHPETGRARAGLYDGFQSLVKDRRELTFVAVTTEEKSDVLVDGVVDEPVTLSSLMLKGMGEIFIPKFIEYFERKNLSSFSIKANISKNEFDDFMELLSRGSGMLGRFSGRPILSERLKARACETLGLIGGQSALGVLKKYAETKEPELRTKAIESMKKIQKRLSTTGL